MQSLALYIHVPFCLHKCLYCDFYSTTRSDLLPRYLMALQREIAAAAMRPGLSQTPLSSVYFGGGTPSLLPPADLRRILQQIGAVWALPAEIEVTLEANPGALDSSHLPGYREAGVNRLSLGIQSFHDHELQLLSRIHSAAEAEAAAAAARAAGFDNLSLDLIFGLPRQSLADWQFSLQRAIALAPEHLSLYGLTIEPETPLFREVASGRLRACDEELEREMLLASKEALAAAGYLHYEISNYARPGRESRHNSHYWQGGPYLGFGPAAHSFAAAVRWWNSRDIHGWLESREQGETTPAGREKIGRKEAAGEMLLLGLRRSAGIDLGEWRRRFDEDLLAAAAPALRKLGGYLEGAAPFAAAAGAPDVLLTRNGDRLALTSAGVLLYDMVCREIYAALSL
jgi:oxygen-independent coproporphyrinogen III oxidase